MRLIFKKTKEKIKAFLRSAILLFFLRKKSIINSMNNKKSKLTLSDIHSEILDMFGYPISSPDCLCKRDKLMYVYGYMMVVKATDDESKILQESFYQDNPAEYFCSEYYNKHGKHVIRDGVGEEIVSTADKLDKIKKNK